MNVCSCHRRLPKKVDINIVLVDHSSIIVHIRNMYLYRAERIRVLSAVMFLMYLTFGHCCFGAHCLGAGTIGCWDIWAPDVWEPCYITGTLLKLIHILLELKLSL